MYNMIKETNKGFYATIEKAWEVEKDISIEVDGVIKSVKVKERFLKAPVTGLKDDRDGESMSQEAVSGMIEQFKAGKVPFFPDHGRDATTGERTYGWKQIMGKWVDAEQDGDKVFATLKLNRAHPDAELFWNYHQEGMPVGFSIGAKVIKYEDVEVEEQ